MPNDFYNVSGVPSQGSAGSSSAIRAEYAAIAAGFDKMPTLTGNALELVRVNTAATGLETVPVSTVLTDYLPLAGGTMTGALLGAAGSASAPGFAFAGDANNGWYSSAADTQDWAIGGTRRMTLDGTSLTLRSGGAQALRIHDSDGYVAFYDATGATRRGYVQFSGTNGGIFQVETALPFRLYTSAVQRMHVNSSGEYGFNTDPVSSVLARFQNAGNNDVGIEFQRTSSTNALILAYDRAGAAYRTLSLSGSTVVISPGGTGIYSFGSSALNPAATNTYGLGSAGADWASVYTRIITRDSSSAVQFQAGAYTATNSQAFTATPTFNAALSNVFEFSGAMTANVTSCTISNASNGQNITIRVKQDATGGRTFAAPSGAKITGSIGATANAASILSLTYSAMDARWEGAWTNLPV